MIKQIFTLLALLITVHLTTQSQTKVSGTVRDTEGNSIPGVSIVQKGTTNGTTTDLGGQFNIQVNSTETVLVFTFVGMKPLEEVTKGRSVINVTMTSENVGLSEVVVTALGMRRDKKTLSFATQKLSGEELTKTATGNFMESLSGKAAGIDIKVSNSGAGGSTKAVLRGNKSVNGLSEPLYVIDGIPMVNNKSGQPGSYGGTDGGDGLSQLNPDDIESINILKGANASVLYGSQGANGVILITTKKGYVQKATVTITSGLTFESVSGLPDFQYEYGAVNGSDYSWSKTKGNYQTGYIKDFFQTGFNAKNSISISGGNDKTTAYFSYANTNASGVMPTNKYHKNNFSFNQSTKLFENKVSVSSNVLVTDERSENRPGAGYYNNPLTGLYLFPRERDFASYMENYQILDKDRNMYKMNWFSTEEKENNPFWELYKDSKTSQTTRAIVNTKLSWDISGHLKLEARGSADYAEKVYENKYYAGGNQVSVSMNGKWQYQKYTDKSIYGDAILSYNNTFGNVKISGILGSSYQHNIFNNGISVDNSSFILMYPNLFSFLNIPYNVAVVPTINKSIKQGVFGNLQLGYKDLLFLDLSGRNDWASTLALTGNESYFYPAVGLSAIVSQMVKLPSYVSFAKIRGSWSNTANEVPFDVVSPWNTISGTGGPDGPAGINQSTQMPFANLKPEIITANEL
ncbi:MAG: SusC/RagA family TonB-linked outer membrane protein, partial [Mariniphaga sp.]